MSVSVEEGQQIGHLPIPTRTGHEFVGWFTSESDGTQIDETTTINGNMTYYAHWTFQYNVISVPGGEIRVNESGNTVVGYSGSSSTITIPSGITSIADSAFKNNYTLMSVALPEGLVSIGVESFRGCTSLQQINIPSSVTSIGGGAFSNCTNLLDTTSIPNLKLVDGWVVSASSPRGIVTLTGVKGVADMALQGYREITKIVVPESTKYIGYCAFRNCTGLTEVQFAANSVI